MDEQDGQQIYNTVTVFLWNLLADGMWDEYGDELEKLEPRLNQICVEIAEDIEEKNTDFSNGDEKGLSENYLKSRRLPGQKPGLTTRHAFVA